MLSDDEISELSCKYCGCIDCAETCEKGRDKIEIEKLKKEIAMFGKDNKEDAYKRHIELLGFRATDKVTGFQGVIDSVCFDLYGCIQVSLKPGTDKDGKIPEGYWFDVTRVTVDEDSPRVVDFPNFYEGYVSEGRKGPADKPRSKA